MEILWSITFGSWLTAGTILLIRLVFGRVLSARAKYFMWMILALRLCFWSLPQSPASAMNLSPVRSAPEVLRQTVLDSPAAAAVSETYAKVWPVSLLNLWLLGVVLCLFAYGVLALRTGARLKRAVPVDDPELLGRLSTVRAALGISGEIRFCYGEEPLVSGLRRPVLLMPREFSGQQLEMAMTHELMHLKSGDLWIAAFWRLLCCVHWFNPVVWLCFHWVRADCERACDQRVLEQNWVSPLAYAELLYAEGRMKARSQVGTTAFGIQNIKSRIKLISKFKQPKVWMQAVAVVLVLATSLFTLTGQYVISTDEVELPPDRFYAYLNFYVNVDSRGVNFSSPGEQYVVTYSLQPVDSKINWSSDDETVATIDEYGVVTAVGPGNCNITATVDVVTRSGQIWYGYGEKTFEVHCKWE